MTTQLTSQPLDRSFFERRDATLVAWLGMAGVVINARGTIILIDPLITTVPRDGKQFCEAIYEIKVPLPTEARSIPRVDWVLYTHADDDHLGRMTAKTLASRPQCKFLAPHWVECILWELEIDEERITTAQDFMTVKAGNAEIYVTPALHDWQEVDPYQRGDCCGYLVKTPDGVIWHPGDTRLIDELLEVKGVDVLFFDVFGVDSHLGPEGSARLAASSGAKVMVAYHYGTLELPAMFAGYDPEDARPYIQELAAKFLVLNPGEPLELPLKEPVEESAEVEPVELPPKKTDEGSSQAREGGELTTDLQDELPQSE